MAAGLLDPDPLAGRLVIEQCGAVAPKTAGDVDDFNRLWGSDRAGPGWTDFEVTGADLVTFGLPDLELQLIRPLPAGPGIAWGAAVTKADGSTYVYGVSDSGAGVPALHVARATDELETPWEYRSEDGWSEDPADAAEQLRGVSHQLTVIRDGDACNAVAHPQTIGEGRLLLSYNVNSLSPSLLDDASIYHPRCVTVGWPPEDAGEPR